MRIFAINNQIHNVSFSKKKQPDNSKTFQKKSTVLATTMLISCGTIAGAVYLHKKNSYIDKLAEDLSKELNKKITRKDLSAVVSKNELTKLFASLKEENFVASSENIKNRTFIADLHSHTNYSDGIISVENFLNQAADYGNKLNKINGKKFIVSITDHDGIEGCKEALKIIAQAPEKYKNIRFIPGAEVSFVMPTAENSERFKRYKSTVQMPEILVYGINPFSKKTNDFFQEIYKKRKKSVEFAIQEAKKINPDINYNIEEYTQFFNPQNRFCYLNQHWKIWNYLQTKTRISNLAKEQDKNPQELFSEIATQINKELTPYSLEEYLKIKKLETKTQEFDSKISEMLTKKILPRKINENDVETAYENKYKDIVNFATEENTLLGLAHPGFTMQNFIEDEILEKLNLFIKNSNGKLKFIEKFHQAYPIGDSINAEELKKYNKIIDKLKLIQIGGRDNHSQNLLPKD